MECLKCGGTGKTLENKPCDCGITPKEEIKLTPTEKHIPTIFQRNSESVGIECFVMGDLSKDRNFNMFLNELVEGICSSKGHPSLFIDLSETPIGAYEVYYALLEKIIKKIGDIPKGMKDMVRVNCIDEERLENSEESLKNGVDYEWSYNYIISDFKETKYENLSNYVKLFEPDNAKYNWKYPLNMYIVRVMIKGGF